MHEVLCIELQKDGSDTWRLEPVVEILKQGGVSELKRMQRLDSLCGAVLYIER